jgi:hypothetical protein
MKRKKKLTPSEARKVFDALTAREQAAAEAYLRTPEGNAKRLADNAARLARARGVNPRKRAKRATRTKRRVNPRPLLYIITAKASGKKMHYDGEKFSERARVKTFPTAHAADQTAQKLLRQFPILRKYRVFIEPNF